MFHVVVQCRNEEDIRIDQAIKVAAYAPRFRKLFQRNNEANIAATKAEQFSEAVLDGRMAAYSALHWLENEYARLRVYHDDFVYHRTEYRRMHPYG